MRLLTTETFYEIIMYIYVYVLSGGGGIRKLFFILIEHCILENVFLNTYSQTVMCCNEPIMKIPQLAR